MDIKEEIAEDFFERLKKDKNFPDTIVEELKKLWEIGELQSQEKILEAIKIEYQDVDKN